MSIYSLGRVDSLANKSKNDLNAEFPPWPVPRAEASIGTATGLDFYSTSGTLTFASGETQKTITVNTKNDSATEPSETFYVNLSGATGGATVSDAQGEGIIFDGL